MEIVRHEDIVKDLKNLRRFSAPLESLEAWERLFDLKGLIETPGIDQYPGFGDRKIYKGRVIALRENFGKVKGYRVIFELVKKCEKLVCEILVFSRHGIYRDENDLKKLIQVRIR